MSSCASFALGRGAATSRLARRPWTNAVGLLADPKAMDRVQITLRIVFPQVIQQAAAAAHQHEQTTATREILAVRLQMRRQPVNPSRQNGDLHLRAAGVVVRQPELADHFRFLLSGDRHLLPRFLQVNRHEDASPEARSSYRLYENCYLGLIVANLH